METGAGPATVEKGSVQKGGMGAKDSRWRGTLAGARDRHDEGKICHEGGTQEADAAADDGSGGMGGLGNGRVRAASPS